MARRSLWRGLTVLCAAASLAACNSMIPTVDFGFSSPGPAPQLVKARQARFAFAPIVGPATPISDLMQRINASAGARKLPIVPFGDANATYIVKGHLSAVGGRNQGTLIYVWDIVDRQDRRIFRVSGQEDTGGGAPDPWVNVRGGTLGIVATRTVDAIAAWLSNQP
ncbi:MAG: hypothetical protein U1E56_10220 [Bauldia sp.]